MTLSPILHGWVETPSIPLHLALCIDYCTGECTAGEHGDRFSTTAVLLELKENCKEYTVQLFLQIIQILSLDPAFGKFFTLRLTSYCVFKSSQIAHWCFKERIYMSVNAPTL